MDKCPVCGSVMTEYEDKLDGWCTLEDSSYCPNGCYSYEYITGTTTVTVKDKLFAYNFRTERNTILEIEKDIDSEIEKAKQEANPA